MCGIFSIININYNLLTSVDIENSFMNGVSRGPEHSNRLKLDNCFHGFHRLAINGVNDKSNQPITIDNITLLCNGEIYNYKELYKYIDEVPRTESDCEIIIYLYKKFGIKYTLQLLNGEYAFIIIDLRDTNNSFSKYIHIARDPFGVRPLFWFDSNNTDNTVAIASELKSLINIKNKYETSNVKQFKPGSYTTLKMTNDNFTTWNISSTEVSFYNYPICNVTSNIDLPSIYKSLSFLLNQSVCYRCDNSDRPVACLLSGGLDSSTVAAIASNYFKKKGQTLQTFSVGLKGSEDMLHAKRVAEYLGTEHYECIIDEHKLLNTIKKVIFAIESYDTTTVRASIGNYLIGEFISKNSDCKVILNGDGSDELFGGYLYFHNYDNDIDFDNEIKHLLSNIHYFDVLRSDRCISSHGLEARTPFLDTQLVNFYLSLPLYIRNHKHRIEKVLLRDTVSTMTNYKGYPLLPKDIIYRKKEAFSDGVSSPHKSFFTIIQETIQEQQSYASGLSNVETEKIFYKDIFDELFPRCRDIIPYYWMPKFAQTNDPSARLLNVYDNSYNNSYNNRYNNTNKTNDDIPLWYS